MSDSDRRENDGDARLRELLNGRLDEELSGAEAAELARLTEGGPGGGEARAFESLARLAADARAGAPPGFTNRVMAAVTASAPDGRFAGWRDLLARALRPGILSAAALLALAVIIAALMLRPGATPQPQMAATPQAGSDMILHRFILVAPRADKVCLVGDFNGWTVCDLPLAHDETTGTWSALVPLPVGRHEYMFVVDDQTWVTDPLATVRVDDGFGHQNAVVFL